jgi:hypothetical protein
MEEIINKINEININKLTLDEVNLKIQNEVCYITINKLKDENLLEDYKKCNSVIKSINKLKLILIKREVNEEKINLILNDYLLDLIPAGTKGVIRGLKFNAIVKEFIINLKLNKKIFEINFEKKCLIIDTAEIPDAYILEKSTNKVLIIMNQLDFEKGGHQLNRGSKYLFDNKLNNDKCKFLCIICNYTQIKNTNKIYNLYEHGFSNKTLCYINNLKNIINEFFNL